MKVQFGMAFRQTTGFVESLLRLVGLDWTLPDFSTLSRRQKTLAVNSHIAGSRGRHLLIPSHGWPANHCRAADSTGIKVEGEDEWHARKHGGPKRRVWRKIHLGIDEETLEIRAVEITGSYIGDAPVLPDLLSQIPLGEEIGSVTADGAYDTRKCHNAIAERGAYAVIPPRKNAKPWTTITAGAFAMALETNGDPWPAAKRRPARGQIPWPCVLVTMERIPPPESRRDEDALCETAGPVAHGTGFRPSGRHPERLHRARHTRHGNCGISPSGERGALAISRFVRQSPHGTSSCRCILIEQKFSTFDECLKRQMPVFLMPHDHGAQGASRRVQARHGRSVVSVENFRE